MGFSDWLTGTKCAECGKKIPGDKFSRTVMGTSVWVCYDCNEKQSEERRLETERKMAAAEERRLENVIAEQKRAAEAAAAMGQRSDPDIAEAMSTIVLREYTAFTKTVGAAGGGKVQINHQAAFMYFLAVASYAFRRFLGLQLDSVRLDRIEETAGRYALAGFIHGMVRNTASVNPAEPVREKLLATLVEGYRKVCGVHQQNVAHFLNVSEESKEKAIFAYCLSRSLDWFGKEFAEASAEVKTRLVQCAGKAYIQAISVGSLLPPQLAALESPVNLEIDFQLPESWCLRQKGPFFRYYDPSTPQYVFMVVVGAPLSKPETPEGLLRRIVVAPDAVFTSLGPDRAIAHYKTSDPENGQQKDDRHWALAESKGEGTR
ncbi:MAG TPA: hypothetical protein VFR18_23160, partial [Terriglobia bacterium]|nr:hypothetical protein [Terriglobia bacterium]